MARTCAWGAQGGRFEACLSDIYKEITTGDFFVNHELKTHSTTNYFAKNGRRYSLATAATEIGCGGRPKYDISKEFGTVIATDDSRAGLAE